MTPSTQMPTVLNLIAYAIHIIDAYLVPLVFALAFITFLFGIYRGFIAGGQDPKKVAEGRQFALWSIVGFAVMTAVWGLVNILLGSVPFGSTSRPLIPKFNEQTQQSQGLNNQFYLSPSATGNAPQFGDSCTTNADCGTSMACVQGQCVDAL